MTTAQFAGYVLSDEPRMVNAVGVGGAAWEIWMQVEMAVVLHASGLQVAREVPYPAPSPLKLDALAGDAAGKYAIELKVESATSAGKAVLDGVVADRAKL